MGKALLLALVLGLAACDNDIDIATCNQFCAIKGAFQLNNGHGPDVAKWCTCVFDRPKSAVVILKDQPDK